MSDSFQNEPSHPAQKRLRDACRTKDTSLRLAWAVTVGEAILLGIAAVALVDYWLMLPVWMRTLAGALLALLTIAGLYRLARFFRRPTPLKEAALDIEAAQPALGCEVSTAAEYLSGERQITKEYEPELVAALEAKAAAALQKNQVPYERRVVRPAVVLVLSFLVLAVLGFAFPGSFTALERAALPFSKAHYTQVDVKPGNLEIPVGRDIEVTNLFTGRAPKNPQVHWQQLGETQWHDATMSTRGSDGSYLYSWRNLHADLKYRVTGNDADSGTFEIKTYIPPEVKDLSLKIEYPEYTHQPATTQKSPEISVVRASTVEIQIDPTVQIAQAKLRFLNGTQELPLQQTSNGSWTGRFNVSKDTDYWIELADAKGHRGGDDKPHHIKAVPDSPPKVEIEDPGQDMRAASTNKVPLKISVADDFGVENIELVFHKLGGQEQILPVQRETNDKGEITASAELDLSSLDLHDYELVAYHARAKDNNTVDGPGVGNSPVYFVEITNLEGGSCKKKKTPVEKVNLIDIQKQIIADTTGLATNAPTPQFQELATRQHDAADFGKIYSQTLSAMPGTEAAVEELQSALTDMGTAGTSLSDQKRGQALPPEESALAHLYQVIKKIPELQEMPTQPPPPQTSPPPAPKLAVVLDAIRQKKKEPTDTQSLQEALRQAQDLARAQAGLNVAMRKKEQAPSDCPNPGPGLGQGQGEANTKSPAEQTMPKPPSDSQAKDAQLAKADGKQGQGNQGQKASQNQGKGKGQSQAKGKGKGQGKGQGQGQGEGEGNPQDQQPPQETGEQPPSDPAQLAQQEQELSKEATQFAEKLQRLAGKDKRLGHHAGQNAHLAGQKIANASDEVKKGNFGAAGVNGYEGELALRNVVAQLERLVQERPELSDVANEEAPKQYETLISEYFKKLSHAE